MSADQGCNDSPPLFSKVFSDIMVITVNIVTHSLYQILSITINLYQEKELLHHENMDVE